MVGGRFQWQFQDKDFTKSNVVLCQFAAEHLLQNSTRLQSVIDCLMSSARIAQCFFVYIVDVIIWSQNLVIPFVAVIRNNLLTNRKLAFQLISKNNEIRPAPALKGPSVGNNLASSDTNCYFVSQPGTFEVV
jgi:hypothetical protein